MPHLPARKRPRLDLQTLSSDSDAQPATEHDFPSHALKWSLEQDYEQRPRKQKQQTLSLRLPIKTIEGHLRQRQLSPVDSVINSQPGLQRPNAAITRSDKATQQYGDAEHVHHAQLISGSQQLNQAMEELAKLAAALKENPEENTASLRTLAQIAASQDPAVRKLALVTQRTVYEDLIPGYRIRPVSDEEKKEKLSKEVRNLRDFEQSIVGNYRIYVDELKASASIKKDELPGDAMGVAGVAIACAAGMLNAASHFNFRSDLLRILVNQLSTVRSSEAFRTSCNALKQLFENDDDGHPSLDAVLMLAKAIKARNYHIHEEVVNLFLHLRLLSEFSKKASDRSVDKAEPGHAIPTSKAKRGQGFVTKAQRKLRKEKNTIAKEMLEADAMVSHEQRDQMQAETLKVVFGLYFRILKEGVSHLTGPVLEGLAKYAHLINQEFFGDILEALKDLISDGMVLWGKDHTMEENEISVVPTDALSNAEPLRNTLLCVTTAFSLLKGQNLDSSGVHLELDLSQFISHLYETLYPLALCANLEFNATQSAHHGLCLVQNHSNLATIPTINIQTTIVLLLKALQAVFIPPNIRMSPPTRIAAFTKQVFTTSLQIPEKSCIATLSLLLRTAKVQQKKIDALWHTDERRGNGVFNATISDIGASNPYATTVWEGELLRHHFAPLVRASIRDIELAITNKV